MTYGIEIRKPNSTNIILPEYPILQVEKEASGNYFYDSGQGNLRYAFTLDQFFSEAELTNHTNIFVYMPVGSYLCLDSLPTPPYSPSFLSNQTTLSVKLAKEATFLNNNSYDLEVFNSSGEKVYIASKKLMTITDSLVTNFGSIAGTWLYKNTSADWVSILSLIIAYSFQQFVGFRYGLVIYRVSSTQYGVSLAGLGVGPPVNYGPRNDHQIKYFFSDSTI